MFSFVKFIVIKNMLQIIANFIVNIVINKLNLDFLIFLPTLSAIIGYVSFTFSVLTMISLLKDKLLLIGISITFT